MLSICGLSLPLQRAGELCLSQACLGAYLLLLSVRQLKAGTSALHKFFQESSKTISRKAASFSCWRDHYLTVLWSDQSPRLRVSLSKVPMSGTGRMSHVPGDAIFHKKGENSFLYSGGSQDPAQNWRVVGPTGSSCSMQPSAWATKAQVYKGTSSLK